MVKYTIPFLLAWFSIAASAAIVIGHPQGRLTMVMVFDEQCPHCQRMWPRLDTLIARHPDLKIRLMPVAFVNDSSSLEARVAIRLAQMGEGRFEAYQTYLRQHDFQAEAVRRFLEGHRLWTTSFAHSLYSQGVERQLQEGQMWLRAAGSGTPLIALYRKGQKPQAVFKGETTLARLEQAIGEFGP